MRANVKRLMPCLLVAVLIMGLQPIASNAEAPPIRWNASNHIPIPLYSGTLLGQLRLELEACP